MTARRRIRHNEGTTQRHTEEIEKHREKECARVSGNWRVTFRFEQGEVYEVDYEDYH